MDIQTIEELLKSGSYAKKIDQFKEDILLIFQNCRQYNDVNTVYWKNANDLEKFISPFLEQLKEDPFDRKQLSPNEKNP